VTSRGDSLPLRNLLARFNPRARQRVLYVAHWDTRPRADSKLSTDTMAPVLGANDGASGVAILLGVADALHARAPAVGVDLLFVDGEDFGSFDDTTQTLLGARRFVARRPPGPAPRFAIVWDMVGDRDQRFLQEGASLTAAPDLVAQLWEVAAALGYGDRFVPQPDIPSSTTTSPSSRPGSRPSTSSIWNTGRRTAGITRPTTRETS
jgi:Zn-dependent M28 family amino/carboxypeptidase